MSVLNRLFGTRAAERSGQSEALAAHVTGIGPALLDAAAASVEPAGEARPPGRRGRGLDRAEDVIADQVAQKVLGFWLQNRHQVLYPLSVNLAHAEAETVLLLARWAAAALQAVRPDDAEAHAAARRWLAGAGADAAALAAFDGAAGSPPALGALLEGIGERPGLAGTAYVAALVALGQRDPASRFFLEFVAARLLLPATVVRSANRRFGR